MAMTVASASVSARSGGCRACSRRRPTTRRCRRRRRTGRRCRGRGRTSRAARAPSPPARSPRCASSKVRTSGSGSFVAIEAGEVLQRDRSASPPRAPAPRCARSRHRRTTVVEATPIAPSTITRSVSPALISDMFWCRFEFANAADVLVDRDEDGVRFVRVRGGQRAIEDVEAFGLSAHVTSDDRGIDARPFSPPRGEKVPEGRHE